MNVKNCRKCGKLFNYVIGPSICPKCKESIEEKFQEVKKFITENRHAGYAEISENCDVEVGQIQQWVREERLVFSDDSPVGINCEGCGAMIKTGRYCEKCKKEVASGFNNILKTRQQADSNRDQKGSKENPKMRFIDR